MRTLFILAALCFSGCNFSDPYPDRTSSPSNAFQAARAALDNRDIAAHFDALTDNAVHLFLQNSIDICASSKLYEAQKLGYSESIGCDLILERHGWVEPTETKPDRIDAAWRDAILQIQNPRTMVVELETNHRKYGAGSSFVWSYLDFIVITSIVEEGPSARAESLWSGEPHELIFERDETGWRFDPNL